MKSEFFIRFCEMKYEDCIKQKSEESCIKRIDKLFDDYNYLMKNENV